MKFYITRCENADFRRRSVRKTAFYARVMKYTFLYFRGMLYSYFLIFKRELVKMLGSRSGFLSNYFCMPVEG